MLRLLRQSYYGLDFSDNQLQSLLLSELGYMFVVGKEVELLCQLVQGSFSLVVLGVLYGIPFPLE